MPDCNSQVVPSSSNPGGVAQKGQTLIYNFVPPIKFPCHEKVIVVGDAVLQQESGNSFQVLMTGSSAAVSVTIWCNALLGDGETEGGKVCENTIPLVLGKPTKSYIDCFKKCVTEEGAVGFMGLGSVYFAILGAIFGFLFGGPLGAVAGGYTGLAIPFVLVGVYCSIKCLFETF